jgi:hypothetical protein
MHPTTFIDSFAIVKRQGFTGFVRSGAAGKEAKMRGKPFDCKAMTFIALQW